VWRCDVNDKTTVLSRMQAVEESQMLKLLMLSSVSEERVSYGCRRSEVATRESVRDAGERPVRSWL
jgi:hypothetical protein